MTATSYNEYVGRLVTRVTSLLFEEVSGRHLKADKKFPALQVKLPELAALIDSYIRHKLFRETIDPLQDDNWRMLLIPDVSNFVIGQVSLAIQKMQTTETVSEAQVRNRFMSEIDSLRMRESYSLVTAKTIYERTPYPSNKGQFEKAFIEYCDADSKVEKFIKLLVDKHYFVRFRYIKDDGLMAYYYPDFIVETKDKTYIVETKAEDQINHPNVQKKRLSALNWIARVNALPIEKRGNKEWEYVIIGDAFFHDWRDKNASVVEMLEYAKLRSKVPEKVKGLFD
jgi:type III restriction enzyme